MKHQWNGIQEFVSTVDTGSFSAAAKFLGVSKSHISKHVKDLETRLGVNLLHRTTRRLQLTNQGTDFYRRCSLLLQNLDDAEAELTEQATNLRGEIRITVAGAFGEDFLAPIIADFLADYPEVSIDLVFTNRRVNIAEEHFDLAFRSGVTEDTSHRYEAILNYRLVTVAGHGYLDRHGTPTTLAQLKDHNCLLGTLPYWRFSKNGAASEIYVEGNWKANNGRALVQAAARNLGIIQVPDFYLMNIPAGKLVPVLESFSLHNVTVWAVFPRRHYLPRRVQVLLSYLKQHTGNREEIFTGKVEMIGDTA